MDLDKLQSKGEKIAERHLKIPTLITYNNRLKSTLAYFRRGKTCNYIVFNPKFVKVSSWEDVSQVLLHEIAHGLCDVGDGHGAKWKAVARSIGVVDPKAVVDTVDYKMRWRYIFECLLCDYKYRRHRKTKAIREVKNGSVMACPHCDAPLIPTRYGNKDS